MRFAAAHKTSSYLMVACAYLALVLSGELPQIPVLLSMAAIPASWWWEPPRIRWERYARVWTIVSALVFAYSTLAALTGGDVLLIGAQFLIYLTINKLFNRRECKDYQQLYILAFLMLVAGTVLNTQFTFGVLFLAFVVTSTWALILFHLRREMEDNFLVKHASDKGSEQVQVARILNSRRIVGRSFFFGTSMVSVTVFVFATLLFLLIPRIGFGLFFNKSRSSVTMAGFSDGVQLGGHGLIKTDDTVVMRVQIDDDYAGMNAPYIHWRGVAFDRYESGQWRRSTLAPPTRRDADVISSTETRYHILYPAAGGRIPARRARDVLDGAVRQEIYLEPTGYDVLFGASRPLAFDLETRWTRRRSTDRNDEMSYPHSAGIKYVVHSDLTPPDPPQLRRARTVLPADFDVYLDIPPEVTERVRELAREITEDEDTAYDKVAAIETWLKSNLDYTLRMQDPGQFEPIDFFLFERKAGHCEYFSSAMAIMVRAIGIPSRNVNGFLGGEWNEYNDYIAVRAGDAHSWVEVYFDGFGWVTFDPTPSGEVDRLGRGGGGVLDRMRRLADTVRFKWFKWVIEYDLYRQMSLFRSVGGGLRRGASGFVKGGGDEIKKWIRSHKGAVAGITVGIAAIVFVLGLLRRRRRLADEVLGTRRPGRARRSPVAMTYAAVLSRLAKRGWGRQAAVTPREHARALAAEGAPGARSLAELIELYYVCEYSGTEPPAAAQTARRLRTDIEEALRSAPRRAPAK